MTPAFPTVVYVLCFLTSGACAFLLFRNYQRTAMRLLLWGALCFALLAANNMIVITDLLLLPDTDLAVPRLALSLMAAAILLFGFIWDGER